jgi:hypothetical protein
MRGGMLMTGLGDCYGEAGGIDVGVFLGVFGLCNTRCMWV